MKDIYPHKLWSLDGRTIVVIGEFSGRQNGRSMTGYDYYFEDDADRHVHWITTEGARIRARMRSEANAKQDTEAGPNDGSSGPQSEVCQEDGHPAERSEGIQPSRREEAEEAKRPGPLNRHAEGEAS